MARVATLNAPLKDPARTLERCRQGDQAAWASLVAAFQNLVYSIPMRMRLNAEDCADVFQSTFFALSKNLDRIESANALPKWLSVTATREAMRVKRLAGRYVAEADMEGRGLSDVLADEDKSAESMSFAAVDAEAVRSAVASLPDRCRELLTLLFFEDDVSYADISERLGMPMGAIGPTRSRCLDRVRKTLQEMDFFE